MGINISNIVESLDADGSSKVQVGNNTTYIYNSERDQDEKKKLLQALRSTDPRHDKTNIEQTNNDLLKEAYIWILENPEFLAWRQGTGECRLLWIRGDPGKGKTMLLCGIIDELRPSTRLGNEDSPISLSFFFCQATNSELNSSTAVLRGLIYLLVDQQPHLLCHLQANIHWDSRVAIETLFRTIVADTALGETYMIVDALDECLEDLEFLLRIICDTVSRIKWIVSSRNRREVAEGLAKSSSKLAISLELNQASVSQAVRHFINHRTDILTKKKELTKNEEQDIKMHLTENAHGTFLWVGLVCQRLQRCPAWEIIDQLSQIPQDLKELYARMMHQIRNSGSCEIYIKLLAVISTVFRPLNLSELKAMARLNLDDKRLLDFIGECGSFLTTRGTTVVFVHQSAKDFLEKESSQLLFQSGLAQQHYALFQRSIDVLAVLRKDMYGLVYPGVSLDEAIHNRPEPDPIDGLVYALVFWVDHLGQAYQLSDKDEAVLQMSSAETVYRFFCTKFLFWLEALSLSRNAPVAGKALFSLKSLPAYVLSQPGLSELIEDELRFFLLFGPVIETHPLQIYTSGLLFSPQKSLIRNLFKQCTPNFVKKCPKADENWSPVLGVFETSRESKIRTMVFSAMGDMLVMTTSDSQLLTWNVNDGSMHKELRYNHAKLLTPSPDLQLLAFITTQNVLEVCELNSGNTLWTVKFNNTEVQAMEIASNSLWLAVCYEDNLDLCNESYYGDEKATREIYRASFVTNTNFVMVSPWNKGVFLWDFPTTKCKEWFPVEYDVACLGYSHGEVWMVISSFNEMFLVDREQGIVLHRFDFENTSDNIERIQVSYGNDKIAVHSEWNAWLFDVQTILADRPKKRESCILDDGVTIASHNDTTIQIENPITEVITTLDIRNTVNGEVRCMALSPDGQLFAYSDWSPEEGLSSINIWDLKRDSLRSRIQVHDYIPHIVMSHNLSQMDFPDDHNTSRPLTLSPNGKWLVSHIYGSGTSRYHQLRLSDAEAGVHYAVIDIDASNFSFIDGSALWTNKGILYFDRILDKLANKSETVESQIPTIDGQVAHELPVIIPSVEKYGYTTDFDWITFHERPLIWLPQRFRIQDFNFPPYPVAIGHHHVISEHAGVIISNEDFLLNPSTTMPCSAHWLLETYHVYCSTIMFGQTARVPELKRKSSYWQVPGLH
ncbi:hypothetical protein FPSE_05466 [Fusarium pseudograminearum CS3096]|uniref:NACHT domain-containing protein n=1 Tax=Fusarium pseudograminearum (strain CS3096) TaxID=1028729 RepID=K3W0M2_FUSPC|nr:hypothetical protein FPSE_05466 [Fusarium pseudograminearum CS3096]EKJ74395.1 hypothetical protein FPSE_05466 [Fusarium pseudograminearum CS3096]